MEKLKAEILKAKTAWASAPGHVKIMAGAYVLPLLEALEAIGAHLDTITAQIEGGK